MSHPSEPAAGHPRPPTGASTGDPATAGEATPGAPSVADLPFDRALADLGSIVSRLEAGGLSLEESIALYEQGVALHEHCAHLLASAELRVRRLVDGAGGAPRALDLRPDDELEDGGQA